jgi:hypothetical protein
METLVSNTFIEKYLNPGVKNALYDMFENSDVQLYKISSSNTKHESTKSKCKSGEFLKLINEIIYYQAMYKLKLKNPDKTKKKLAKFITKYIDSLYDKINVLDADINYILKGICESYNEKFNSIIQKMNISHIIKMIDYTNQQNEETTFKILMEIYFKLFGEKILCGKYGKSNNELYEQLEENWSKINFSVLFEFSEILSKLKYNKADTSKYDLLFEKKFDDIANIQKLLEFVNKNYLTKQTVDNNLDSYTRGSETCVNSEDLKYNFRFIIENSKSNGFLLFEQYYKNVRSRHDQLNIDILNRDLKLTKHFITVVSRIEQTNVNRYVNDMLIRIRNYLFDLQESYYNNETYKKIKIRIESEKYKEQDITKLNRELTNFKMLKYNYRDDSDNILARAHTFETPETDAKNNNIVTDYTNMSKNLVSYFDIYRSYYKTRYPDRELEYDLVDSTIIVKIKFNEKPYYIHMALIQYVVLDKIMQNPDGSSVQKISESLGIPLSKLNDTFNSLLKIKIVKRTSTKSTLQSKNEQDISNIKFVLNKDFTFEKNKLSIYSLVKKEKTEEKVVDREFLHDRNMILLCNLVNYAKKNTYFTLDTIMNELSYKIPFKITQEQLNEAIKKAIEDEYIKPQEVANSNGTINIMYQYYNE